MLVPNTHDEEGGKNPHSALYHVHPTSTGKWGNTPLGDKSYKLRLVRHLFEQQFPIVRAPKGETTNPLFHTDDHARAINAETRERHAAVHGNDGSLHVRQLSACL